MKFKNLKKLIKLSPKTLWPIGLVCGFLLLANDHILERLGLDTFVLRARPWIGVVFIFFVSWVVTGIFTRIGKSFKSISWNPGYNQLKIRLLDLDSRGNQYQYDELLSRADRLANYLLERYVAYHDQRENIAHAGLLLQVTFFAGIMVIDDWPPLWAANGSKLITFIMVFVIWSLAHTFIRWNGHHMRWAALQHGATLRLVRKWTLVPPSIEDLKPGTIDIKPPPFFDVLLDFIFPWPRSYIIPDVGDIGYPVSFLYALAEQKEIGTRAVRLEWFFTLTSFILFLPIVIRTIF